MLQADGLIKMVVAITLPQTAAPAQALRILVVTAVIIALNHFCHKTHPMVVALARVDSLEVQLRITQGMVIAETEQAAILTQDDLVTTIN